MQGETKKASRKPQPDHFHLFTIWYWKTTMQALKWSGLTSNCWLTVSKVIDRNCIRLVGCCLESPYSKNICQCYTKQKASKTILLSYNWTWHVLWSTLILCPLTKGNDLSIYSFPMAFWFTQRVSTQYYTYVHLHTVKHIMNEGCLYNFIRQPLLSREEPTNKRSLHKIRGACKK